MSDPHSLLPSSLDPNTSIGNSLPHTAGSVTLAQAHPQPHLSMFSHPNSTPMGSHQPFQQPLVSQMPQIHLSLNPQHQAFPGPLGSTHTTHASAIHNPLTTSSAHQTLYQNNSHFPHQTQPTLQTTAQQSSRSFNSTFNTALGSTHIMPVLPQSHQSIQNASRNCESFTALPSTTHKPAPHSHTTGSLLPIPPTTNSLSIISPINTNTSSSHAHQHSQPLPHPTGLCPPLVGSLHSLYLPQPDPIVKDSAPKLSPKLNFVDPAHEKPFTPAPPKLGSVSVPISTSPVEYVPLQYLSLRKIGPNNNSSHSGTSSSSNTSGEGIITPNTTRPRTIPKAAAPPVASPRRSSRVTTTVRPQDDEFFVGYIAKSRAVTNSSLNKTKGKEKGVKECGKVPVSAKSLPPAPRPYIKPPSELNLYKLYEDPRAPGQFIRIPSFVYKKENSSEYQQDFGHYGELPLMGLNITPFYAENKQKFGISYQAPDCDPMDLLVLSCWSGPCPFESMVIDKDQRESHIEGHHHYLLSYLNHFTPLRIKGRKDACYFCHDCSRAWPHLAHYKSHLDQHLREGSLVLGVQSSLGPMLQKIGDQELAVRNAHLEALSLAAHANSIKTRGRPNKPKLELPTVAANEVELQTEDEYKQLLARYEAQQTQQPPK